MNICVLSGGVGAARFLVGLQSLAQSNKDLNVTAIVNTGDDEEIYGNFVCPDLDSVLYHLANINDEQRGWGRKDETFVFVETLKSLGEDAWFNLGDRDLALNNLRTNSLKSGNSLYEVTQDLLKRLDIKGIDVVPMCDEKVTTTIETKDRRTLRMQEYFVRERCNPKIANVEFVGAPNKAHPAAIKAIEESDLIIIAPSNPYLSIMPIFAIEQINCYIRKHKDKVIAISPIVSGTAIKGPLAQIMNDQSVEVNPIGIASLYVDFISTLVIDNADSEYAYKVKDMNIECVYTNTVMDSLQARENLAKFVVNLGTSK